jgi:hypothetical protein
MRDGDTAADWLSEQRFAGGKSTRAPGWDIAIFNQAVYFNKYMGLTETSGFSRRADAYLPAKHRVEPAFTGKIRRALGRLGVAIGRVSKRRQPGNPGTASQALVQPARLSSSELSRSACRGPGHHNAV